MFFRFLMVGGIGYLIDAGMTFLLVFLGLSPWAARIPAIALAMIGTWLANRYFTFRVEVARSFDEAVRYFAVAAAMAVVNYLVYLLLIHGGIKPLYAVTIATICQAVLSFNIYRFIVFKRSS